MEKTIAILTSGGDAPGMNAAIRATVLAAAHYGIKTLGVMRGYNGLIDENVVELTEEKVRNIIHQGGTILKSARCKEFKTDEGIERATKTLEKLAIDSLIVIGGDGSFTGLCRLQKQWHGKVIGIPGTIDNDIDGTDLTIGYSTAINTCIEAIDKIRDTADAFERIFLVEVMGRHSGYIAMNVGIATAAEQVLTFETHSSLESEVENIKQHITACRQQRGDCSYIIVIAENLWPGGVNALASLLSEQVGIDCTPCVLGHIQRGGRPVAKDRVLATRLGVAAVEAVVGELSGVMVGEESGSICYVPLDKAIKHEKTLNPELIYAQNNILDIAKLADLPKL